MSKNRRHYDVVCCRHGRACEESTRSATQSLSKAAHAPPSAVKQPKRGQYENLTSVSSAASVSDVISSPVTTSYASVDEDMPVIDAPMDLTVPIERAMATRVYSLGNVLGEIECNRIRPITSYGKAMTQEQAAVKQKEVLHRQNLYARFFLGCKTHVEAEAAVQRRTSFRLYYLLKQSTSELIEDMSNDMDNALTQSLPLYVIYRSSAGDYRHYKVKTTIDRTGDMWYYVDYGDPRSKTFRSIYRLVEHYSEFATIPGYKGRNVDVFPFWKGDTDTQRFGVLNR